jgi:hypothetical protein
VAGRLSHPNKAPRGKVQQSSKVKQDGGLSIEFELV